MSILIIFLVAVNVYAFFLYGRDKKRAEKHQWRTSEFNLLLAAFLGGSVGSFLGMLVFRHKISKMSFMIKFGIVVLLQIALLVALSKIEV
jgi:uncharacterized membrane protein YsdA (DUF1294 family)